MRLPHQLLKSPYFVFANESEFVSALGPQVTPDELLEIERLRALGLPPVDVS